MRLQWPGINSKGTVLIDLALETFHLSKAPVSVAIINYTPKDELHVTLVGEKVGAILQDKIKQVPRNIELLKHIFEGIDWSFEKSGPIHILSRSSKRGLQKSIIMLIDMPGVTTFYHQLKLYDLIPDETPVPPAHVTLYTYHCPLGIGVPNDKTLHSLSKRSLSVEDFENKLARRD